jgi:hypothetical protein
VSLAGNAVGSETGSAEEIINPRTLLKTGGNLGLRSSRALSLAQAVVLTDESRLQFAIANQLLGIILHYFADRIVEVVSVHLSPSVDTQIRP